MASSNIDLFVDETYLVALINEEPLPISDEKYAHELTLQEALYLSSSIPSLIHLENDRDGGSTLNQGIITTTLKNKEVGESSSSSLSSSSETKNILCGICMESKNPNEIFSELSKCNNHTYCIDCMKRYVTIKIRENISFVECPYPNCKNKIEPQNCISILPREVFDRWENALCEALILGSQKFYCPYKECSALMIDDAGETVLQAECPSCRRLFCARCRVTWHVGFTCEEYLSLKEDERGNDDLMVIKLAKDKQWKRCSNCSFYVEKKDGCVHMTCRCHYEFCYTCGNKWSSSHSC